jgi:hypothetical protein
LTLLIDIAQDHWDKMSARPSVVTLSKTQDQRYMFQMTKDAYCPLPPPAWLNLLGWCTAAVVFGALAVIAYNKKVGAAVGCSRQMACTLLCSFLCFAPCCAHRLDDGMLWTHLTPPDGSVLCAVARSACRCAATACSSLGTLAIIFVLRHSGPAGVVPVKALNKSRPCVELS